MLNALNPSDRALLDAAIEQAEKSLSHGGIPIGAALADATGCIIAAGHNQRVQTGDSTAHAEIDCIRNAGRRRNWRELTMATTLSPCVMCTGAALLHQIPRIIIGENVNFMGAEDLLHTRSVTLIVAHDQRCISMMRQFTETRSDLWNEDIGL